MVTVYPYGIKDTVFKLRSIQKYIELVVWPSKMIQQCTTMAALDVIVFVENYNEVRDLSYVSIDIANVEKEDHNDILDLRGIDFRQHALLAAREAEPF